MQSASPAWVEKKLSAVEDAVIRRLQSIAWIEFLFWPALGLLLISLGNTEPYYPLLGKYFYTTLFKTPVLAYLFLSFPLLSLFRRVPYGFFLYVALLAAALALFPPAFASRLSVLGSFLVVYLGFSFVLFARFAPLVNLLLTIFVGGGLTLLLAFLDLRDSGTAPDMGWWILRPASFLLPALTLLNSGIEFKTRLTAFFFPAQWIFTVALPLQALEGQVVSAKLRAQAILDAVIAFSLFATLYLFWKAGLAPGKGIGSAPTNYLFNFFSAWAIARLAVGCGRMLGFNLPDIFHFPLLATNPLELWRRWNSYFYRWAFSHVYLPVLQKSASAFAGIAAVFGCVFFTHEMVDVAYLALGSATWKPYALLLYPFAVHFFLVSGAAATLRWWPQFSSRYGWIGVGLTHAGMLVAHAY